MRSCIFLAREYMIRIASYTCLWFSHMLDFGYARMQALDTGSYGHVYRDFANFSFPHCWSGLQNFALPGLSWNWKAKRGKFLKGCSECFSSPAGCRYYWRPHEKDYSNKIFTLASWTKGYKKVLNKYPNLRLLSQTQTLKLLMQPC